MNVGYLDGLLIKVMNDDKTYCTLHTVFNKFGAYIRIDWCDYQMLLIFQELTK